MWPASPESVPPGSAVAPCPPVPARPTRRRRNSDWSAPRHLDIVGSFPHRETVSREASQLDSPSGCLLSVIDIRDFKGVSRGPMRTRLSPIVLALLLVASIVTLTPLAYADPPDPTWVAGVWDDDDFDDVVVYITSAAGLVYTPGACALRPVALPGALKPPAFQAAVVSAPRSASSPRAPPTF